MTDSAHLPEPLIQRCRETALCLAEQLNCAMLRVLYYGFAKVDVLAEAGPDPFPAAPVVLKDGTDSLTQGAEGAQPVWRLTLPITDSKGAVLGVIEAAGHGADGVGADGLALARLLRDGIVDQFALYQRRAADPMDIAGDLDRARQAQEISDFRFKMLVENSLDDFFMHDDTGHFLHVNDRACRSLGYTREELLTMSASDVSKDLTQEEKEELYRVTAPGATARIYGHHTRKDGTTFPVEVLISCHLFDGQKVFLGMVRDRTEEVASQEALESLNRQLEDRVAARTEELRDTSDLLQAVIDSVADTITLVDTEGRFQLVNRAAISILPGEFADIRGRTIEELLGPEKAHEFTARTRRVLCTGESETVEELLLGRDGESIRLTTRTPRRDDEGNVTGLVTISRDITELKRDEIELKLERERMTLAAEVGGLGVLEYRPASGDLVCSDELRRIFGLSDTGLRLDSLLACVDPEDRALFRAELAPPLVEEPIEPILFRIRDAEGQERWLSAAARYFHQSEFVDARVICVVRDVTEQHVAERKVQDSYDALRRAERLARIGSWSLDPKTNILTASEMLHEMNGVSQGQGVAVEDLQKMMPPDDFARLGVAIEHCIRTGEPYTVDVTHYDAEGGSFAAEIRGAAVRDDDGQLVALSGTVQDVSEREASRAQLTAIADSLPNGAIYRLDFLAPDVGLAGTEITGDEMRVSYVSAGIDKLIGVSAEKLVADPGLIVAAIHPDDRERYFETSRRAAETMSVFDCEFRVIRPDGDQAWLQIRSAVRESDQGQVWDGIILDVTKEYETAEALRQAKDAAEAAERAKSEFLATMSHEIRTPMNAVIGMTRLVMQTDLSPRQHNYLTKIDSSARVLLGIINDILDVSRIEAGGLELEETDFTLESVLETLSNATSLKAEEKGLEIVYAISPSVPRQLCGDPLRLGQVLINLVSNAVKFTERGEIVVSAELLPPQVPGQRPLIQFSIRDTGIGLTPEQSLSLFKPFSQADTRTARRFGGTGLGLSISKKLVELMGGEIRVESQLGRGSTFSFTFASIGSSASELRMSDLFQGKRALIVDDMATSRETLSNMIGQFGVVAQSVSSGAEALAVLHEAAARNRPFDIVLMDWRMPGMDGVETARMIRNDRFLRTTPAVLMVTAHAGDEILRKVDLLDLQGLLIKPVTESMLYNAVQQVFEISSRAEVQLAASTAVQGGTSYPAIIRGRRVLVVDDNLFNLEVAADFLELAGVLVTKAESGFEALRRLQTEDFDAVLMDMQMPDMDGLETTRRIRQNPEWLGLPVIALTAQARIEDREATLQVGMTAHLTKPIDEKLMYATLAGVLEEEGLLLEAEVTAELAQPQIIDLSQTLARVHGDESRMRRMIELFVRDFSDCPGQLRDALAVGDSRTLAAVAHRARGVAGYFAADRLFRDAEALELLIYDDAQAALEKPTFLLVKSLEDVLSACRAAL
ncbi:PAS domain-containing hybrid sensor histidine kinase/response regulator [Paracoccus aminophilus]|uniref:Sensory/regulatory protein RpfC n=1 Tax=Paracoccus aminophilus JCM 7686 TaxID=1367847 RepID=S5Z1Q2_PARAH|nr:PAS domain S-box protein [Paracoccus aminophilus]AGT11371.1 multi-sensor hybrid histidine kinase [Paracoccus aminophilus JCM 7686]